jgi:hypothetical protein
VTISREQAMRLRSALRDARAGEFPRFRRSAAIAAFLASLSSAAAMIGLSLGAGDSPGAEENQMKPGAMATASVISVVSSLAATQHAPAQAVEWKVSDGGNGHWYESVRPGFEITWSDARAFAHHHGGYLASVTSLMEDDFVWEIASDPQNWNNSPGPWLGGRQLPGATEPAGGWTWDSGEPFVWLAGQAGPYNGCGTLNADSLHYFSPEGVVPRRIWNDFPGDQLCGPYPFPRAFIMEWSADCNSDGIVDFGQIQRGELVDSNHNNIPDSCELRACPSDITRNGVVDGVDLALILATWGSDGVQGSVNADVNRDGMVDGADLALLLGSWGLCQ